MQQRRLTQSASSIYRVKM